MFLIHLVIYSVPRRSDYVFRDFPFKSLSMIKFQVHF